MKLKEIRSQMWVIVNGRPARRASEREVKRWAALRLIENLNTQGRPFTAPKPHAS